VQAGRGKRNFSRYVATGQQRADQTRADPPKNRSTTIEAADKLANADRREEDSRRLSKCLRARSLERSGSALKIDDSKLRSQVINLIYFRSQTALKEKKPTEARRRCEGRRPDQRAYLNA
jgi:hypothetical protein